MKKLVVLISCLTASFISFSQNNNNVDPPVPAEQSSFSLGFQGGFGHAFITPYKGSRFQPSWDAGIAAIYAPGAHWGIELDVRYSEEGAKIVDEENRSTNAIYLSYVRVPLKAVYFFRKYENDFRPKIGLGPAVGFLTEQVNSRGANSFDYGANASLGFHYRLVRAIWLTADLNYYQGFKDIYEITSERELNGNARLDLGLSFGF
jgi:hypothetical protein